MRDLPLPLEPLMLKRAAANERRSFPNWNSDSLRVWFGNELPSYLWTTCGWRAPLAARGMTWGSFLQRLSNHKADIKAWIRGSTSWSQLAGRIQSGLAHDYPPRQ